MSFQPVCPPSVLFQQKSRQLFCLVYSCVIISFRIHTYLDADRISVRDTVFSFSVTYSPGSVTVIECLIDGLGIYVVVHGSGKVAIFHRCCMGFGICPLTPVIRFVDYNICRLVLADITILFADHFCDIHSIFFLSC